jgi:hypothetical protein
MAPANRRRVSGSSTKRIDDRLVLVKAVPLLTIALATHETEVAPLDNELWKLRLWQQMPDIPWRHMAWLALAIDALLVGLGENSLLDL